MMTGEEIQVENGGYTRIHNAIMETLLKVQLSPLEFKIILFILRKTYGYQKKMDKISISQFEECGAGRANTFEALQNLLRLKIIIREQCGKQSFEYGFNKYSEQWLPEAFETRYKGRGDNFHKTVSLHDNNVKKETVSPIENETVSPVDRTVSPVDTKPLAPMIPTKERKKLTKEIKERVSFEIPPNLDFPEFKTAWDRWAIYRKEIKHSLTPSTATAQLKQLSAAGPPAAIAMINQSIEKGWQGLFPVRNNGNGYKPERQMSNQEKTIENARLVLEELRNGSS